MPVYWGDLHGHSDLSTGRRTPEEYYAYARDEARLDFCALTDQLDNVPASRLGLMAPESWDRIKAVTREFNEQGRFVTLLGCERSLPSWEGLAPSSLCLYFKGDGGLFLRPNYPQRDWLRPGAIKIDAEMAHLWQALKDVECLKAIVHSGSARQGYAWAAAPKQYDIDLVEVYSKCGSSEAEATPFPMINGSGHGSPPGRSAHDALAAGFRPGFIGGSDTHFSMPGSNLWENDWANSARYDRSGLTAVFADELTRPAVFDALKARRCYVTTCERIELLFTVNGSPMGSVLATSDKLRVHVHAAGTQPIKRVEVFKNGEVAHRKIGTREELDMYLDDAPASAPTWYYVRVTQAGEATAWSSPIWVTPPQPRKQ